MLKQSQNTSTCFYLKNKQIKLLTKNKVVVDKNFIKQIFSILQEKLLVEKCKRLERKLFSVESQLHETKCLIERVAHENKTLIGEQRQTNGVLEQVGSDLLMYACKKHGTDGGCQRSGLQADDITKSQAVRFVVF